MLTTLKDQKTMSDNKPTTEQAAKKAPEKVEEPKIKHFLDELNEQKDIKKLTSPKVVKKAP